VKNRAVSECSQWATWQNTAPRGTSAQPQRNPNEAGLLRRVERNVVRRVRSAVVARLFKERTCSRISPRRRRRNSTPRHRCCAVRAERLASVDSPAAADKRQKFRERRLPLGISNARRQGQQSVIGSRAQSVTIYTQYFIGPVKPARTTIRRIAPGKRDPDDEGSYPTLEQLSFIAVRVSRQ
jgi:hypothetical protein